MNLTRAQALIDTLEADPGKLPAYFMCLESVIAWLMDETFASTDADEKVRLAATEARARGVLKRYQAMHRN